MSLVRHVFGVSGMVLISRVLGLVRDLLMTRYLGAGAAADAFFVAFKLPNFFRRLFAEGAFSAGFVPLFAGALGKDLTAESRLQADALASTVLSWFLPVLLVVLVVMEAAMVPVMLGLTGGYGGDESGKFALTVLLGRLTFPYLFFISLCAFLSAILNAYDRFRAAAFAPVLLNIGMISAVLLAPADQATTARWLAAAVSLSGIAQAVWLWIMVRRLGVRLTLPRPRISPEIKRLLALIAPAAIGAGVIQLNLLVDVVLAARFLENGAVSWLFYADRLNQLAVGMVGVATGMVLLPRISRYIAGGDDAAAIHEQNRALEFAMLLTLPAATALMIMPGAILGTLFERGAFTASDTAMTAAALIAYASGLPAYVLVKIFTPGFHGRQDTRTPVAIAMVALASNVAINLALIGPLGHIGLAIGTSLSSWLSTLLLAGVLLRRKAFAFDRTAVKRVSLSALAAAIMGAGLWAGLPYAAPWLAGPLVAQITGLGGLVLGGGLLYAVAAFTLGGVDRKALLRTLKRR